MNPTEWPDSDVDFLKKNHKTLSPKEMEMFIDWNHNQIFSKLSKMGLPTKKMYNDRIKKQKALSLMNKCDPDFRLISKQSGLSFDYVRKLYNEKLLDLKQKKEIKQYFKDEEEIQISVNLKGYASKYKYEDLSDSEKQIFDNI